MSPLEPLRERLVTHVRGVFNDPAKGEAPTPPSDQAWFEKDSPIRLVHADVVGMLVGGVRSLLLQMLHPHALQGVLDFSDFRADMHGRLKRTARFIAVTTFAHRSEAQAAIDRINRIHAEVSGTLPDGTPYDARDPRTLAWVHVVGAQSFLAGYMRYVDPHMSRSARDEYFEQFGTIARKLGADPVPRTQAQATAIFDELKCGLRPSPKAREVARLVLAQRPEGTPRALQQMIAAEAVTLLPDFARRMLHLDKPRLTAMPARLGTLATARTLRWAFRQGEAPKT